MKHRRRNQGLLLVVATVLIGTAGCVPPTTAPPRSTVPDQPSAPAQSRNDWLHADDFAQEIANDVNGVNAACPAALTPSDRAVMTHACFNYYGTTVSARGAIDTSVDSYRDIYPLTPWEYVADGDFYSRNYATDWGQELSIGVSASGYPIFIVLIADR